MIHSLTSIGALVWKNDFSKSLQNHSTCGTPPSFLHGKFRSHRAEAVAKVGDFCNAPRLSHALFA
jgi:hypothetical protein